MNFKLLLLPEMALLRVFGSLSPMELLELSLCSKKTSAMIVSSRNARYCQISITNRNEHIEVRIRYRKDYYANVYFNFHSDREPMNQRRIINGVEFKLKKTLLHETFEIAARDRIAAALHIADFLIPFFNPKFFSIFDSETDRYSRFFRQMLRWERAKNVDFVELMTGNIRIKTRLMNEMLEKWFGTRRKRLEWMTKVDRPGNLIALPKFDFLQLCGQRWLKLEKFCALDARKLKIQDCRITIPMLIRFVQKWMDNAENFSEFRCLKVEKEMRTSAFDYRELIRTFSANFFDGSRPEYNNPGLMPADGSNCERMDIRSSHGKLATMFMKRYCFEFRVWE